LVSISVLFCESYGCAKKNHRLEVIWKCARRARDYLRGYRVLGGGELPKKDIEEQAKEQKRHRDVLNFSSAWIRSLLALYQPNAGGAASTQ
jgi:hypothetical protein